MGFSLELRKFKSLEEVLEHLDDITPEEMYDVKRRLDIVFDIHKDEMDKKVKVFNADYDFTGDYEKAIEAMVEKYGANADKHFPEMIDLAVQNTQKRTQKNKVSPEITKHAIVELMKIRKDDTEILCAMWEKLFNEPRGLLMWQVQHSDKNKGTGRNTSHMSEGIMEQGIQLGRDREIFTSVQEGDYSIERGAQKMNLPVSEFVRRMETFGYLIPGKV